ncbi:MAG TPA: FHA domain-containing protein [Vicinamibacterales bacterium]|nr:FHA domain-containing protein [Vicinamibacterales bacterium]
MQEDRARTLSFDAFTLDVSRGCLRRGADDIKLRPKSFDVLRYLVENPGRLVSKEELIRAVWRDAFVTDNSIVQCLIEIRRALRDDAQTIIRTVPRRGYIFDVSVIEARHTTGPGPASIVHWLICDGREQPLPEGSHVIGRDVSASISLRSPKVSREHARIVIEGGVAVLEDLGSKNGTFLRGQAIKGPVRLADGDEIRIGAFQLTFLILSSDSATATA